MAVIQGAPGYRYAVVPHPVSNLDVAGLRAHAALAGPQVLEILRGTGRGTGRGTRAVTSEPGRRT